MYIYRRYRIPFLGRFVSVAILVLLTVAAARTLVTSCSDIPEGDWFAQSFLQMVPGNTTLVHQFNSIFTISRYLPEVYKGVGVATSTQSSPIAPLRNVSLNANVLMVLDKASCSLAVSMHSYDSRHNDLMLLKYDGHMLSGDYMGSIDGVPFSPVMARFEARPLREAF